MDETSKTAASLPSSSKIGAPEQLRLTCRDGLDSPSFVAVVFVAVTEHPGSSPRAREREHLLLLGTSAEIFCRTLRRLFLNPAAFVRSPHSYVSGEGKEVDDHPHNPYDRFVLAAVQTQRSMGQDEHT
jgi:hypothetical protein